MLSFEQFEAEVEPLERALELRRLKYLRYFYTGVVVAALLLASAFFRPESVLHALQQWERTPKPLGFFDITAYRIFAVLCTGALILGPITAYRGERGFSVVQSIWERLLEPFGAFLFIPGGAISAQEIRRLGFSISSLSIDAQAGITGEMNGVRIRISDAALYRREGSEELLAFKGLILLADLTSSQAQEDARKTAIGAISAALDPQKIYWDEKIIYVMTALYAYIREAVIAGIGKNELPAEKAYRLRYATRPRILPPGRVEKNGLAPTLLEYSSSTSLGLAAGESSLFTLGSLFEPAFGHHRIQRLYAIMKNVDLLTRRKDGA